MKLSTSVFTIAVTLALPSVTSAVCSGYGRGIGSPVAAGSSNTQYKLYDTSCNVLSTYTVPNVPGVCASRYFLCKLGTKLINGYDDPVTGWAWNCTTSSTESCGSDKILGCCNPGYSTNYGPDCSNPQNCA